MSDEGSVVQEAEHAGISRMPVFPARPVDISAVRPRRWREPNSDWRTVVRPPTTPSGDSPYVAPDLSGLKITDDNSANAFRIDVNLLKQKQEDVAPEEASNDMYTITNETTGTPRHSISDSSLLTTPASPKAPKLKPQLGGKSGTRGRAARLSTSSSAVPVRATFQYPYAYAPSGNGTIQYSPATPRRDDPPRPPSRRGRDTADNKFSFGGFRQQNGFVYVDHDDNVVHPPPSAAKPRFRRPRTMYKVAACQDMSVYVKIATEGRESSTPSAAPETRKELLASDTPPGYAEVLKIEHAEPHGKDAKENTPGYILFESESGPTSETGEEIENQATSVQTVSEGNGNSEANRNNYWWEEKPYSHVAGFDPDEYILDLFDQGRITATQRRQAYSSGVEFPDSAYHIEQMFGLHGEENALFVDDNVNTPVHTVRQYSFDDHAMDLLVGAGNTHQTVDDIIYSYEHGGLGNGGTGNRHVENDERAWSKLLGDLTEVEGLLESSEPVATNVVGRQSGRKKQKKQKGKKKGSNKKRLNGVPERRKSTTKSPNPSFKEIDSREVYVSPELNELKLAPPGETQLTAMYSETPEERRYREVRDVNRYVTMMDNRKSILDQFGPDPTGKKKCKKPRPVSRPHDPLSSQLDGTEGMYDADDTLGGGTHMTENTQNAIAFLYGDKEVFERRPSGYFAKAAADSAVCQSPVSMATDDIDADFGGPGYDPGEDWTTLG
ncbi:uncharacterized protein LOC118425757 [Branchiostoma floridae]|uniref:Uncharacterized protein LOC118425757 n=1 Tax=Branchiostoma floridae TaxID=7739 RepID=C3XVP7_BRAFL|nr:uncharacterized protein LOC118425757 [Branchiostoma floridae]XP_035690717.1 uncharacterized protein LOC118425757 [Branchiostoma floridae]|eukprot:XP_002611831.1 hypothetical protein BRAFLDRAFT_123365 [Branchiostoma floridae]